MKLGFLSSGVGEGDGLEVGLGLGIALGLLDGLGEGEGVTSTAGMTTGGETTSLQISRLPTFTHFNDVFFTTLIC